MNWETGEKPKPTKHEDSYVVWMYDTVVEIGYCNPALGHINGENEWVDFDGEKIESEDGVLSVMAWCRLERPKNRRLPTIKRHF